MFRFFVLLSFLALSHGFVNFTSLPKGLRAPIPLKTERSPTSRIIGGRPTTIEKHPYAVSIQHEWEEYVHGWAHYCTGTIISKDWILATGHCGSLGYILKIRIHVGSTLSHEGGTFHDITDIIIHPQFNEFLNDYDLSLLKPEGGLTLSNVVKPITLPSPGATYPEGTIFTMPSWGADVFLGNSVPSLLDIDLPTITTELCKTVYSDRITDRLFCSYEEHVGMCIGDTGAPAVVDGVVIGIASWHYACSAYGWPSVYVDLPVLVEWITEKTGVSSTSMVAPEIGLLVAAAVIPNARITEN